MCKCNYCGEPLHREIEDRTLRVCDEPECLEEWLFGDLEEKHKRIGADCARLRKDREYHCPIEGTLECGIYCPDDMPGW